MRQEQKRRAAEAALDLIPPGEVLGVGTGSTVEEFLRALAELRPGLVRRAVSSSRATSERLRAMGIEVVHLDEVGRYPLYIDGADEFDPALALVKGGGGALTGEKILASAAEAFACIVDASKRVDVLGRSPVAVEVLPMARRLVSERVRELGGRPVLREGFVTDHGNAIVDVHGLRIEDPVSLEIELDATPGVVCSGLFARRRADLVLMGTDQGVQRFE